MATAPIGQGPLHSSRSKALDGARVWLSGGSDVVIFVKAMQPDKQRDYVGQASRRYQSPALPVMCRIIY